MLTRAASVDGWVCVSNSRFFNLVVLTWCQLVCAPVRLKNLLGIVVRWSSFGCAWFTYTELDARTDSMDACCSPFDSTSCLVSSSAVSCASFSGALK